MWAFVELWGLAFFKECILTIELFLVQATAVLMDFFLMLPSRMKRPAKVMEQLLYAFNLTNETDLKDFCQVKMATTNHAK